MVATAGGRRLLPPVERPIAGAAVGKRRERPRPRRANLAPRPSTGSLTPHVLLSMPKAGAARMATGIDRVMHGGLKAFSRPAATDSKRCEAATFRRMDTTIPAGNADAPNGHFAGAKSRVKAALLRSALRGLDTRLGAPDYLGNYRSVGGVDCHAEGG